MEMGPDILRLLTAAFLALCLWILNLVWKEIKGLRDAKHLHANMMQRLTGTDAQILDRLEDNERRITRLENHVFPVRKA